MRESLDRPFSLLRGGDFPGMWAVRPTAVHSVRKISLVYPVCADSETLGFQYQNQARGCRVSYPLDLTLNG